MSAIKPSLGVSSGNPESGSKSEPEQDSPTLFSQFRIQYDELRLAYEKLLRDFDDVNREKRKIEIKFLNANPEYYEKEIRRLREELQKSMEENEENKFKYMKAANLHKEVESLLRIREADNKKLLAELQKEKVSSTELKHSSAEKQRVFSRIRVEFERSNKDISQNYEQLLERAAKLEQNLKLKSNELDSMSTQYNKVERQCQDLNEEARKCRQIADEKIKWATREVDEHRQRADQQRAEYAQRVRELAEQLQRYEDERTTVELITSRKQEQANSARSIRVLQLEIGRLEDVIRDLKFENESKNKMITELEKTITHYQEDTRAEELESIIKGQRQQKSLLLAEFERERADRAREIEVMKLRSEADGTLAAGREDFHSILRVQIDEKTQLKKELSVKIDEVYNLKQEINDLNVQKEGLLAEIDIFKRINASAQKNSKIEIDVVSQALRNEIEAERRKCELLEAKLAAKIREVREKDSFIKNSILGRSRQEDVPLIMLDLQRIFEANYAEKLNEAHRKIEELQGPKGM